METKDLIIVGAGPAGVTAAIYAKRKNIDFLIFEKYVIGGQVVNAFEVENYPGFSSIHGFDLALNFKNQLKHLNIEVTYEEIVEIKKEDEIFHLRSNTGEEYLAKKVILALGSNPKKLAIENEDKFLGRGVSYCAVCDGAFYKNDEVSLVGENERALKGALYLANLCKKVYLINRFKVKDSELFNELKNKDNVEVLEGYNVKKLSGNLRLEEVEIENKDTKEKIILNVHALFIYVGYVPSTSLLNNLDVYDESRYIKVDENLETKVKGLYAIGDCTEKDLRQIVTAVSDGGRVVSHI
ncbi:MAG: FAD-dependent oxidoreductase [Bacilli bacterium]|nr:FAD-dependent oxidoreductase [Bacilli bacterium]